MSSEGDKELDDLLDTALEDFDKKLDLKEEESSYTIEKTNIEVEADLKSDDEAKSAKLNQDEMKLFEEIFNDEKTKQSMMQFKDVLTMFGDQTGNPGDAKNLLENLEKVMSELTTGDEEDDQDFEKDLEFLKNLAQPKQAELKPKEPMTLYEDDIDEEDRTPAGSIFNKVLDDLNKNSEKVLNNASGADIFSKLNFAGDDGDEDMMMEPILSMLFSKDVLHPSLKLMHENYDKYLKDKKDKLSPQEIEKCQMQKDCIEKMCNVYENSKESDSKENKADQLKQILDLLEKCGMPPDELVPEVNPFEMLGDAKQAQACPMS
ncbi:Peroxisomal biogenesis factor 19 [Brachionus plicatilis]|uniref:Peroxin-19 n=1 Tax=Brachionus plicatilis TaxID=10195 RepID=A0A3M7RQ62_BRAPC|nr:Peroxisomal biogenesis factor 19 [Brachionus plicatilis]